MYSCSVSALLQSCDQSKLESKVERLTLEDKACTVWHQVADLPVTYSTCASLCGQLLAVGGKVDTNQRTDAVYMYSTHSNSWEIISRMKTARARCFTALLPNNRLMVLGGSYSQYLCTDEVEVAHLIN